MRHNGVLTIMIKGRTDAAGRWRGLAAGRGPLRPVRFGNGLEWVRLAPCTAAHMSGTIALFKLKT